MRHGDGGKGSERRKAQVPRDVVDANYDRIFGKKPMPGRPDEPDKNKDGKR